METLVGGVDEWPVSEKFKGLLSGQYPPSQRSKRPFSARASCWKGVIERENEICNSFSANIADNVAKLKFIPGPVISQPSPDIRGRYDW